MALIATAVILPVLVALVVVVDVVNRNTAPSGGTVAEVSGATATGAGAPPAAGSLPPLDVDAPPVDAATAASCTALMRTLPARLLGEATREVRSATPYVQAWGDPAVVLVCGVGRPAGFVRGANLIQLDAVQWFVDTSNPDTVVWTAVDRPVYVQVRIPASSDSAPVTELSQAIAAALPAQSPSPAP